MQTGTSGRNAIQGFGGFNFSEHNIQRHRPKNFTNDYNEQDHDSTKKWAGINPLNPPEATGAQKLKYGANAYNDWRERTLHLPVPGQVAGSFGKLAYASADTSLLQRNLGYGFLAEDPTLRTMLEENEIAPQYYASMRHQADPYLHSDVNVPSVIGNNYMDNATHNTFPRHKKHVVRGKHDHTNLKHRHTPAVENNSNVASGTHHTSGIPTDQVTSGYRITRGPLERPLLLSDLPAPPMPMPA